MTLNFSSSKDARNLGTNSERKSTFDRSECRNNHLEPELSLSHTHTPILYSTPNASCVLKAYMQLTDTHMYSRKMRRPITLRLPVQHGQK